MVPQGMLWRRISMDSPSGLEVDPLDVGGERFVGGLVFDVVDLGAAYDVFLLLQGQLLPVAHGVDPALHVDVGATGELAAVQQRHLGAVLILRVLGAVDETGRSRQSWLRKPRTLGQFNKPGQQGHDAMTGMMQHVHPISTQLHEEIERGIGAS